jgi:signal transduction histidine kinase
MRRPRLPGRLRPGSPVLDGLLALALAALVQGEIWTSEGYLSGPKWVYTSAGMLMTLPLAARRRAPLVVVAIVSGADVVQSLLVGSARTPDSVLIGWLLAIYTVAAHTGRRQALVGLAVALAASLASEPGDFVILGAVFLGVWLAGRLFQDRQRLATALQARTAALERDQGETARLAIAEERARIARELHDVVAHSVSVMVLQAGAERLALGKARETTREALLSIETTGRQALAEMRRLLGMLRTEDEELALAPQPSLEHLESLIAHVGQAGLPVELEIEGKAASLPPGVDISAYRIVQEALTNALKHAGPARVRVIVRYGDHDVEVEVTDDGRGAENGGASGHGLVGMRERVALYGGELQAGRANGGGYIVRARLPFGSTHA